jgi:hypothetical protein
MRVPSAVLPEECNMILNPRHPEFRHVELIVVRPFVFDQRMFKQQKLHQCFQYQLGLYNDEMEGISKKADTPNA